MPRPSRSPYACVLSLAVALTLFALTPTMADVQGEVRSNDQVVGTIDPADEVETFRIQCAAGAKIKAKLKGDKKGGALSIRLLNPADEVVFETVIKRNEKKNTATFKNYVVPRAGSYAVAVFAVDGTTGGSYSLKISCKPPKKSKFAEIVDGEERYDFFATVGTTIKAKVKPGKGSVVEPRLLRIEGPSGYLLQLAPTAKGVSTGGIVLPRTGSYALVYDDGLGGGGDVSGLVTFKAPKLVARTVDVRSTTIDPDGSGSERAIAQVVGGEGANIVVPPEAESGPGDISGTGLFVPAGALLEPVALVVATAPLIPSPPGGLQGAGPTVFFGPEGIEFAQPVTITLPFDIAAALGNADALQVYTRDAAGNVTLVDPTTYTVDLDAGTCSFPVSHFSSFRVFVTPPPLTVRTFIGDLDGGPVDIEDVSEAYPVGTGSAGPLYVYLAIAEGYEVTLAYCTYYGTYEGARPFAGGGIKTEDGTPAADFQFVDPVTSVAPGNMSGSIFVATTTQVFSLIRASSVDPWRVTRFAGTGAVGDAGDGGPAPSATFTQIQNIAVGPDGSVVIVDRGATRVRRIDGASGLVEAVVGTGTAGIGPDGAALTASPCLDPTDIVPDPTGTGLYLADGARVRFIDAAPFGGPASNLTFAGAADGTTGSSGDGGPLLDARFQSIRALALDEGAGLLVILDDGAHTIRTAGVVPVGTMSALVGTAGVAGNPGLTFLTPGAIDTPTGFVVRPDARFFIELGNDTLRQILPPGAGE